MLNEKKQSIICHSIAIAIVITIMTILCFKNSDGVYIDLAINHALSNAQSFFGIFFMCVGEYPAYFLIPIGGVIFFYNADRFEGYKSLIWKIFSCIVVFLGIFVFCNNCTKLYEIDSSIMIGFAIFFGIFLGAIALAIGALVPKDQYHKLFKFAVFIVAFTLIALIVVQIMKGVWARMRYRDMLKEGNFDGFTPWFMPQKWARVNANPDYDYTSFPSGHTSSACHIFVICLLPYYFKKLDTKKWRIALYVISIVFTVTVAISRIVNNAHYLSDVTMGGAITYALFYALKSIMFKNGKYEFEFKEKLNATF